MDESWSADGPGPAPVLAAGPRNPAAAPRIWQVGALCRAIADALEARFNPVAVRGEVSGFSRAASGHCYFALKDAQGQVRCAMFRRAASLLEFMPRDGELVEVQGRLGVYEPRGELQLVVEAMRRAGQGALYEQFLRLKAKLAAEGLFDPARKRPLPALPHRIGLVTSLGAAALHDTLTCLRRRAPHVAVVIAPASVQGAQAPDELAAALGSLFALPAEQAVDIILLVRGGGSIEDLWAFNDERVARAIVRSPVPVVSGVGHETDFTIADFCADVRAPTPTAAAELAARTRESWLQELDALQARLTEAVRRRFERGGERVDRVASRLGRPLSRAAEARARLDRCAQQLRHASAWRLHAERNGSEAVARSWRAAVAGRLESCHALVALATQGRAAAVGQRVLQEHRRLERAALKLKLLDPRLVLQRGYALITDEAGQALTSASQFEPGQPVRAALSDGAVDLRVVERQPADRP